MSDSSRKKLLRPLARSAARLATTALYAVFLSGWINVNTAEAAKLVKSERPTCRYTLEGTIEQGDLAKIEEIAQDGRLFTTGNAEVEVLGDEAAILCLNSPGGSFLEGVAIAKFISKSGIATVIDAGQSCASACAIVFMAGRTVGAEDDYTNRKLHIDGVLGFHRPFISLPNSDVKEYTANDINQTSDVIMDAITFFLSLSNQQGNFNNETRLKPSLIEAMLRTGRDDLLYVDTVDKAGRWEIDVFGYERSKDINREKIYNTCANFIAWRIDQSNADDFVSAKANGLDTSTLVTELNDSEKPTLQGITSSFRVMPGKSGYASVDCIVNVYENAETEIPTLSVCARDGFTGLSYGNCYSTSEAYDLWVTPIASYPPNRRLSTLGVE